MIIEVKGSAATPYKVDTNAITCTCPDFKHRRSNYSINNPDRLCKHLKSVFENNPELAPSWYTMGKYDEQPFGENLSGVDPDGKTRYARSFFDPYVSEIKSVLRNFSNLIDVYEFCGSYRRMKDRISDLDVLIVPKDGASMDPIMDYFENVLQYEKLWRGDKKASYKILGIIQVDFKFIPKESWPFAVLHYTGSKDTNIEMRRRALTLGYKLNEYELRNTTTGELVDCKSERDIFNALGLPYLEPWKR